MVTKGSCNLNSQSFITDEITNSLGRLSFSDTAGAGTFARQTYVQDGRCHGIIIPHMTFDGMQDGLEEFLLHIETYFHFHPAYFATEADKVLYTAAFLRGKAAKSFNTYVREWLDSKGHSIAAETQQIFSDFGLFKAKLHNLYGTLDKPALADRRIRDLRQTENVSLYAAEFLRWATDLGWNDAALRSQFFFGLTGALKSKLVKGPGHGDLPELIMAARKAEEKMLLSRRRTSNRPLAWNTSRTWIRCFSCHAIGHIARYCPRQ